MFLTDVFCDGGVTVEVLGANARVTWHVMQGNDRVPRLDMIVPVDSLRAIAQQFAKAALLAGEDRMGPAAGQG